MSYMSNLNSIYNFVYLPEYICTSMNTSIYLSEYEEGHVKFIKVVPILYNILYR